jgi:catechol 2,3-dioxygenase-like lactoylglutathione lyase family enzyme
MVLEWETATIKREKGGDILPFLIEDKTLRSARIQPSPSVKGTDLSGIGIVVLGVKDLDASLTLFRRAFGLPAPTIASDAEFGAKMAYFPGTPVLLAMPLNERSSLATQLNQARQGPVGLLLRTQNFTASCKRFQLSGETSWFGRKIAWFDAAKLHGARLGVVE